MKPTNPDNEQKFDSPNVRFMPPLMFLLCLTSGAVFEFLMPLDFPWVSVVLRLSLGAALMLAGFIFMMCGHRRFTKQGVNVKTILPASMLVTEGAYSFSRNPMYVGFVSILAGLGLTLGILWILLAAAPMVFYLAFYVIPREEAYLQRRFTKVYEAYCTSVRRWL